MSQKPLSELERPEKNSLSTMYFGTYEELLGMIDLDASIGAAGNKILVPRVELEGRNSLEWTKEQLSKYDGEIDKDGYAADPLPFFVVYIKEHDVFMLVDGIARVSVLGDEATKAWLFQGEGQKYLKGLNVSVLVYYRETTEEAIALMAHIHR